MHRVNPNIGDHDPGLVRSLLCPAAFPHEVGDIEMIETHISWVILAGKYAYKIKKPIRLDFLDFRDLEKRHYYCREEVRLNRRWAPNLYIDVVPIAIDGEQPRLAAKGPPVEYAVRMFRFDDELRLDRQLDTGALNVADLRELAVNIASRHERAPVIPGSKRTRSVTQIIDLAWDNFVTLEGIVGDRALRDLREWTQRELVRIDARLWQRFDDGRMRDCHGDLHLGNIVRLPDGIMAFDCIEFSEALRTIDVICDIGFLFMDLVAKDRADLAYHFLNRYLERTGDYSGVDLLDFYVVYRALVRAKVAAIRGKERGTRAEADADREEVSHYLEVARRQISKPAPVLIVMSGLSGSGKTRVSGELMAVLPALRVRSDIERKRMFALGETDSSGSGIGQGIYSPESNRLLYRRLHDAAHGILAAGHGVILDAAYLGTRERSDARRMALEVECRAVFVRVEAPIEILRDRVRARSATRGDASEADLAVLERQIMMDESPSADESSWTLRCDNRDGVDIAKLVQKIRWLVRST